MQQIARIIGFVITTVWLSGLMQSDLGVSALKNLPVGATSRLLDPKTLLTRRKRYIFFTPGSAVQVTMTLSKALIARTPRGVIQLVEMDVYYPLQSSIADWFPKKKKKPTVLVAVPVSKPKIDDNTDNSVQNEPLVDRYYATQRPTNYWNRPITQNIQIPIAPYEGNNKDRFYTSPTKVQYYNSNSDNRSHILQQSSYDSYYRPWSLQTSPNANGMRRGQSEKQQQRPPPSAFSASDTTSRRRNTFQTNTNTNNGPPSSLPGVQRPIYYSDWQKHHRGYRERRDIYTQFEAVARGQGLDIRSCILRLICESRHYLIPQGKSFFHDVMRILFYVPNPHSDPYAKAMSATIEDCTTEYRKECRISILGLLLHPDKPRSI